MFLQIVDFLLAPSNLLTALGLLSVAGWVTGHRRFGGIVGALVMLLLAVCGWSPLGPALLMALENRFPPGQIDGPLAGVVMLGGAIDTHIAHDRGVVALSDAGERVAAVAELSRRYPQARILLSGGAGHAGAANAATESSLARDMLVASGVPASRIELEAMSRDTCENATGSKRAARPAPGDQWLLVTSASHMPRAVACFRATGFTVAPYPVDYRTRGAADLRRPTRSAALGLQHFDLAAHEWIGLLGYRISGRTRELFPSP